MPTKTVPSSGLSIRRVPKLLEMHLKDLVDAGRFWHEKAFWTWRNTIVTEINIPGVGLGAIEIFVGTGPVAADFSVRIRLRAKEPSALQLASLLDHTEPVQQALHEAFGFATIKLESHGFPCWVLRTATPEFALPPVEEIVRDASVALRCISRTVAFRGSPK